MSSDDPQVKAHGEYIHRMLKSPQFTRIGVEPQWVPGIGDIDGFIHDEVVRQYHDPRIESDGGIRIRWMKTAWEYALSQQHDDLLPGMDDILRLGAYIEPRVNSPMGFRLNNVYIANSRGAPPALLTPLMMSLVQQVPHIEPVQGNPGPGAEDYRSLWSDSERLWQRDHKGMLEQHAEMLKRATTADDWYLAYEAIHPFGDGNGRSGKVLHNWLLGTLMDPVLVMDYFAGGNP